MQTYLYTYDKATGAITPTHDVVRWSTWFGVTVNRIVEQTMIGETVMVSTVFLGIDHGWGDGGPILFETMTFYVNTEREGEISQMFNIPMLRYATPEQAREGHERVVTAVKEAMNWTPEDLKDEEIIDYGR